MAFAGKTWVAYDAISGDVLADGFENEVRRYAGTDVIIVAASEADWRRAAKQIARRMSGNPPRRRTAGTVHL